MITDVDGNPIDKDNHDAHYLNGRILIRKSMLEDFSTCPWKFKRIWLDGVKKTPNQAMLVGTRFHDFAETFFSYCAIDPSRWHEFIPHEFTPIEREMASWFLDYEHQRLLRLQSEGRESEFRPIMVEQNMVNEKLYLESRVDRVDWHNKETNEVCIVEYKTGGSVNWESLKRQLAFYTILWESVINLGHVSHIMLINPRLRIAQKVTLDPWEKDKVIKDISKMRTALRTSTFKHTCSDIKLIWCRLCDPSSCGMFDESSKIISFVGEKEIQIEAQF